MVDKRRMLKVKIKTLACEARLIRMEERRSTGRLHDELWYHRIHVVRKAAREALLAYGFLRGRSVAQMEARAERPPEWKEVEKLVGTFGVVWNHPTEAYADFQQRQAAQLALLRQWAASPGPVSAAA